MSAVSASDNSSFVSFYPAPASTAGAGALQSSPAGAALAAVLPAQAAAKKAGAKADGAERPPAAVLESAVPKLYIAAVPQRQKVQPKGPGPQEVNLGAVCEQKIDSLIGQRLGGGVTDRTNIYRRMQRDKANHYDSALGQIEAAGHGFCSMLSSTVEAVGSSLLNNLHFASSPAICTSGAKAEPIVIDEDDESEPPRPQNEGPRWTITYDEGTPDDSFGEFVSKPRDHPHAATAAVAPVAAAPDQAEDRMGELPAKKKPGRAGRKPGDTASALSLSGNMTSSAASLLGGLGNIQSGPVSRKEPKASVVAAEKAETPEKSADKIVMDEAKTEEKERRKKGSVSVISSMPTGGSNSGQLLAGLVQGDGKSAVGGGKATGGKVGSKSVIAGGIGTSSSAQVLADLAQKQSEGKKNSTDKGGTKARSVVGDGTKAPRQKGESKTVITGMQGTNSNAGALLAGLVNNPGQGKPKRSSQSVVA